ncbi:MAG TPA: lantibiotic dehydratase [Pseudonocardiaceae bacterium]|nr:lantibiotic dehydratase [Pseudonocardiaceae bacterium]
MSVETARYGLVRTTSIGLAAPSPAAVSLARMLALLVRQQLTTTTIGAELVDVLHDSSAWHSTEFHQQIVLPLRRDVHNNRMPRPALREAAASLIDDIPLLAKWLCAREELDNRIADVQSAWPAALAEERAALAALCTAEEFRKACVLTSRDLLHGIDRTAQAAGAPDKRARKVEPTVLRYALRAATKTSPLSWFTQVGWGVWADTDADGGIPVSRTRVSQPLVARLTHALVRDPARRFAHPHRLAPALRIDGSTVRFQRDVPALGALRAFVTDAEEVELPVKGPLSFVLDAVGDATRTPADLAKLLAARLPRERADEAARTYLAGLLDLGVLVPVAPVDPQHPDPVAALSAWLGESELARRLDTLRARTEQFATVPASARPAELAELRAEWQVVGESICAGLGDLAPLAEDVVLDAPARLGPGHGRAALDQLAELTPLFMLFDHQLAVRRVVRNEFVRRFGVGGEAEPTVYAELLDDAWGPAMTGTDLPELWAARQRVRALVAETGAVDRVIPAEALALAAEVLPDWLRGRPASYSVFGQPYRSGLVVNHLYTGFGRFTSRFLDRFGPEARDLVAAQQNRIFGGEGFAQLRRVAGFGANLHPLLGDRDVDDITGLVLRHDPVGDEVRVCDRRTGQALNILYLGFLLPSILPERMAGLYSDLACGWADLDPLRGGTEFCRGRLSYRDVVLARASWDIDPRAEIDGEDAAVAIAAARLRAKYRLPAQVFVGTGGSISSRADFEGRVGGPKPQYVDLDNALHLRCLRRTLARYPGEITLTEALPVPRGPVVEVVAETYWSAR